MRQLSRSKKALLNTIVLAVYQIISFVCGLILPRLIMKHFGSTYNGICSSITQFLSFITILQVGIAGSTRFSLYKVLNDKDTKGISGIVNATERYMKKVGLVLLIYIGILALVYPLAVRSHLSNISIAALVVIIGAGTFAQYFFGITYQILLNADQRQYVYYLILSISTILNTVVAVVLMATGNSIHIVKLGSAFVFVLQPIILGIIVKHDYNIDKSVPPNKEGLKGRRDVMWHSVANIIHNNVGLVSLNLFANQKIVSVYSVHYLIFNSLSLVLSIFTMSLESAFGSIFANKEYEKAYNHLEKYEFFMCFAVIVVFSSALTLIEPFVSIYTEGITDVNYIVPVFAYTAVIAQAVMCLRQPYLTIVQAAGHYKQTRNGAFIEAAINIVLSTTLTYVYGIIGVAIGLLVANTYRTVQYVFYLSKNIVNRSARKAIKTITWTLTTSAVVVVVQVLIVNSIPIFNWSTWVLDGVICFMAACVISVVSAVIFYKKRFMETVGTIFHMVFNKR